MLLRLVIMASVDGVWSSRKIAKLACENVVYMYLTGMETPDFRTICNFKIECQDLIEQAFKKTVTFSKSIGMVKLGHIAIDGTKIKANASNNHTLTEKEIDNIKKIIQIGIDVDAEEDELYGEERGDQLPPELNTRKKIREKLKEIERKEDIKLKKPALNLIEQHAIGDGKQKEKIIHKIDQAEYELQKSGQEAVSLSDPEARFMDNKKNLKELSYNLQIAVDHDSGIILASSVTQDPTDHYQLKPQIELVEENLGKLPKGTKISADNGFFTGENLEYLEKRELDGYIPNKKQAGEMKTGKKKNNEYSKDKFTYNTEEDNFTCPHDEILTRKSKYKYNGKQVYAYYGANCAGCHSQLECTGKGRKKVITSNAYEGERQRMAAKMQTPEGKKEYKKRKETVEWPFGNIKYNLNFTEFLTRGVLNTGTEKTLVSTSHNLKRIWNEIAEKITKIFQNHSTKHPIPNT
ncbi:MAG: IS1182 family transposase [Euryarchaeota archaeon]|nr:IS1182 family transposase [Euryarchaeota archaeon]